MFEIAFGGNPFLRYTKAHFGYLIAFIVLALSAYGLLGIGVIWNLEGTRHYNLYVAMLMQVIALGIYAMPGHFVLAWIGGYIRHQAGGQAGLNIEDGIKGGNDWAKKIASGLGTILFWISFPWIVAGVIDFRGLENLIGVTLTISIPIIVGAMLLYPESIAFRKFVWWSYVSIIIAIFIILAGNTVWRSFTNEVGHTAADVEVAVQNKLSENDQKILSGILRKARSAEVHDGDDEATVQNRFIESLTPTEAKVYQKYLTVAKSESPIAIGKGVAKEAKNTWEDVWYEKKAFALVDDFQDKKITNVRPGTRKFEIPGEQFLVPTPGNVARDLKGAVLMNGAPEGSDFVVGSDGIVTVSFTFAEGFKRENIPTEALSMPVIIK